MTLIFSKRDDTTKSAGAGASRKLLVITGGSGPERMGSLMSADHAATALRELGHDCTVRDLDELAHTDLLAHDAAFLAIHGWYGEDGKLQAALDLAGVAYNGSGVASSAVSMHKPLCNRMAEGAGLHVPRWEEIDAGSDLARIFDRFGGALFLKPTSGGGSLGAGVVRSLHDLATLLEEAQAQGFEMMATQLVEGTDVTVGLVEDRGEITLLPPLATLYDSEFYDYATKHDVNLRRHQCPPDMHGAVISRLHEHAARIFRAVGCHGYGRVDFVVDKAGVPWFLEINTLPGLSRHGNLATMAAAHGWGYNDLIKRLLATSREAAGYRP